MNFGYTTKGGSTLATGKFFASRFICPDAGILNSVSVYLKNASGSAQNVQIGIYNDAAGAVGTALIYSATLSLPIGFDDWRTVSLAGNLLLGGAYWLTVQLENSASIVYLYYDAGAADQGAFKAAWTFGDWSDNPAGLTYSTNKISISASYTYVNPNSFSWFQMPKSQIDPEKLEEAIARLVLEHCEDEEAHLGVGQSLQSHKAAEIIDHLAASIIADKIKDKEIGLLKFGFDREWVQPNFESLDSWAQAKLGTDALIQFYVGNAVLRPGNAVNDYARIGMYNDIYAGTLQYAKNPFFQVMLQQLITGKTDWGVACGDNLPLSADPVLFGFQYILADDKVYAFYVKTPGTWTKVQITGVDISQRNVFRAEMSNNGATINFYVNAVLRLTVTDAVAANQNYYLYIESKRKVTLLYPCLIVNNIVFSQNW
jgi:hypothetical protein